MAIKFPGHQRKLCKSHPQEQGESVYLRCYNLTPQINGKATPEYMSRGTFQYLANERIIGWHPSYMSLLPKY
ncbi:ABC-three component system protein [Pseudomonas sp. PGPPP2]|uniref:ABC-three component system protein n=1 Tax=Pseudomonas sp. PGPPP2 TaxID=2015554 RepID=UPI00338F7A93